MKLHKLFYTGMVLAVISLFSACQADSQVIDTQTNETGSSQSLPSNSQDIEYSLADHTAYQGAQETKDATFCTKIENESYQKQCQTDLADQAQLEKSIAAMDNEGCKKLSTADKQKACQIQMEVKMKQQQQSQELKLSYEEFNKLTAQGDYLQCKTLKDPNLLSACEETILTNKALTTKEKNWCEKNSNEEAKQRCLEAMKSFDKV